MDGDGNGVKSFGFDRRTIRLRGYDYSQPGVYFITVCARERESLFGQVVGNLMERNESGEIVSSYWGELANRYTEATLDAFVVMPNHMHGIVLVGAIRELPLRGAPARGSSLLTSSSDRLQRRNMLVPKMVGWFKMNAAKQINHLRGAAGTPVWQRNYWEHVIRDEESLNRIREYIATNPARWHLDAENPLRDGNDDFDKWLVRPHAPVGAIHELPPRPIR